MEASAFAPYLSLFFVPHCSVFRRGSPAAGAYSTEPNSPVSSHWILRTYRTSDPFRWDQKQMSHKPHHGWEHARLQFASGCGSDQGQKWCGYGLKRQMGLCCTAVSLMFCAHHFPSDDCDVTFLYLARRAQHSYSSETLLLLYLESRLLNNAWRGSKHCARTLARFISRIPHPHVYSFVCCRRCMRGLHPGAL